MIDSERMFKKCKTLNNDQLCKALLQAFTQHNKDLEKFKDMSGKGDPYD